MERRPTSYRAFLLRVWMRPRSVGARASIRDVDTGETRIFGDLAELHEWLDHQMRVEDNQGRRSPPIIG